MYAHKLVAQALKEEMDKKDATIANLLEALERLVLAFDVGDMKHTTLNGRGYAALDESRKAIAKATA